MEVLLFDVADSGLSGLGLQVVSAACPSAWGTNASGKDRWPWSPDPRAWTHRPLSPVSLNPAMMENCVLHFPTSTPQKLGSFHAAEITPHALEYGVPGSRCCGEGQLASV